MVAEVLWNVLWFISCGFLGTAVARILRGRDRMDVTVALSTMVLFISLGPLSLSHI